MPDRPQDLSPPPVTSGERDRPPSRVGLHVALFLLTTLSTVVAYTLSNIGASGLREAIGLVAREPSLLLQGVPFAATLMAILTAHEMGHYLTARHHGVDQSLPYFIPAPTIFGTLGALILMRSQPNDHKALLDVAVVGPYAGLLLAVPATVWGLAHSTPGVIAAVAVVSEGDVIFGDSLLFAWLRAHFGPDAPLVDLHPVAVAGWVGLFVTSLNLIPAAQLDGGHIAYALFGRRQERLSTIVVVILFALGLFFGFPRGAIWMFWALFLFIIGIRHPPVKDESIPLTRAQRLHGWVALLIFLLTFTPVPIEVVGKRDARTPGRHALPLDAPSGGFGDDETYDGPAEEFRL
ncbi:MAG: site-2 protease family protein [Myxococcota bacterium]